jgi:hypothetical protein
MNRQAKLAYVLMLLGFVTVLTSSLLLINIERTKSSEHSSSSSSSKLIIKLNFTYFLSTSSQINNNQQMNNLYLYWFCNNEPENSNAKHSYRLASFSAHQQQQQPKSNIESGLYILKSPAQTSNSIYDGESLKEKTSDYKKHEYLHNDDENSSVRFKLIQSTIFKYLFDLFICSSEKIYMSMLIAAILFGIVLLVFGCFQFCKYDINFSTVDENNNYSSNHDISYDCCCCWCFKDFIDFLAKLFTCNFNDKSNSNRHIYEISGEHSDKNKSIAKNENFMIQEKKPNHLVIFDESKNNVVNKTINSFPSISNLNNSCSTLNTSQTNFETTMTKIGSPISINSKKKVNVENTCPFIYEDLPAFIVNNTANNKNNQRLCLNNHATSILKQTLPPPSRLKAHRGKNEMRNDYKLSSSIHNYPPLPQTSPPFNPIKKKAKHKFKTKSSQTNNDEPKTTEATTTTKPNILPKLNYNLSSIEFNDESIKSGEINKTKFENIADSCDELDGYDDKFIIDIENDTTKNNRVISENYDNICMFDNNNEKVTNQKCSKCLGDIINDETFPTDLKKPGKTRQFQHIELWKLDGLNKMHNKKFIYYTNSLDRGLKNNKIGSFNDKNLSSEIIDV